MEDNRVADEDDTHPFLKETLMHTCTVILLCDSSSLLLECHLTCSLQLLPLFITSCMCMCACTCVCVCVCTQLCLWSNIPRSKMQKDAVTRAHRPPSLQIHPSCLIIFAKSTINLMDPLCFWSLVMKSLQSKVISLKLIYQNIWICKTP